VAIPTEQAAWAWRGLERAGAARLAPAVVFACSLALWWLEAIILPLAPGRDLGTYLGAYAQLFQAHPIDLGYVLNRAPIAPLVMGGLLDLAGGSLAEPAVSLLFAASVCAWFAAARSFSGRAGLAVALVLLLWPGYAILFHELSADGVFAAGFAGWSLLAVRVFRRRCPSLGGMALLGLGAGGLALTRPGNQALLVLALLPLAARAPWRRRLLAGLAFASAMGVVLAGWTLHNGLLYGNYTFARGGNATIPFFRAFVTDKIVRPENGPASRELARAVRRELLPQEPYRSYGITLDAFFAQASPRMQEDLVALSDRLKGWRTNHRWLRDVGVEAVRAHPGRYAKGVAKTVAQLLSQGLYRPLPGKSPQGEARARGGGETILVNGHRLPKPSEGEPIPAPHEGGVATPDGSIYTVWISPTERHLVFVHPGDEARYRALRKRMGALAERLPDRGGSPALARRLNQASRWYPPAALWLAVGLVALLLRRRRGALALALPAVAGMVVIVLSALGLPAEPRYSLPVAPAFLLLAAGATLAEGGVAATRLTWAGVRRLAVGLGAALLALAAAAWAAQGYLLDVYARATRGDPPHDLEVFLRAAGSVLDGASPYAFRGDATYAYPPLLAFLATPLELLGVGTATVLWSALLLTALAVALWLLGVRDWRCYCLAAAYPATRSAVGVGAVGPLLLLALAVAWRWRQRLLAPAAAAGAAVALKLFLWPLVFWLGLRRRATGAAALGLALAFALLPWAILGFAGLKGYPRLLRRLADGETWASYSLAAMGMRAHLPQAAALALSLLVAVALLALAAWVAARGRGEERLREVAVVALCLAAALAASPIVWLHYFVLLLAPIALLRPRLSLLWLVPLAQWPLPQTGWPGGDPEKLAVALLTTLAVLAGAALPGMGLGQGRSARSLLARRRRALLPGLAYTEEEGR
jgi:hypothetical protein